MKKLILAACVLLLLMSGCAIMDAIKSVRLTTDETGQVTVDPNSVPDPCGVAAEVGAIAAVGTTTQNIGLITGNPAIAGAGVLIALAGSIIGGIFIKRKK